MPLKEKTVDKTKIRKIIKELTADLLSVVCHMADDPTLKIEYFERIEADERL